MEKKYTIGFIGQGWIGKNYADDFERRGYRVVRYSLEEPFAKNKSKISECDIVFIAVPTPTTPDGFDYSTVKKVLPVVGKGKIAVIKSTILPGVTEALQDAFPDIFVFHSPEFLSEATAARDSAFPPRNIVGIPRDTFIFQQKAEEILSTLPHSPYNKVCSSREAELIKYAHNCAGFMRIMFSNILYDVSQAIGADWKVIEEATEANPFHGPYYHKPLHKTGRGAGGHCFIKDFASFRNFYEKVVKNEPGLEVLKSAEKMNINLLEKSRKDLDLLRGVYGSISLNDNSDEVKTAKKTRKLKVRSFRSKK